MKSKLLALVGTVLAILKFVGSSEKLSGDQKEIYIEVSSVIGKLISNDSFKSETILEFNQLYNGKMILVEDRLVSRAMRRFKFELDDKLAGRVNILNPNKFQITGMEVIKTCRNALDP